jgi:hypothetical protein
MQGHRLPHDQRLKNVALQLLDQQDDRKHDEGVDRSVGHQGQQDGDGASHQGTHHRDE